MVLGSTTTNSFGADAAHKELNALLGDVACGGILPVGDEFAPSVSNSTIKVKTGIAVFSGGTKACIDSETEIGLADGYIFITYNALTQTATVEFAEAEPMSEHINICQIRNGNLYDIREYAKFAAVSADGTLFTAYKPTGVYLSKLGKDWQTLASFTMPGDFSAVIFCYYPRDGEPFKRVELVEGDSAEYDIWLLHSKSATNGYKCVCKINKQHRKLTVYVRSDYTVSAYGPFCTAVSTVYFC